jgi:hypothetical protein
VIQRHEWTALGTSAGLHHHMNSGVSTPLAMIAILRPGSSFRRSGLLRSPCSPRLAIHSVRPCPCKPSGRESVK